MDEPTLRHILGRLGVRSIGRANKNGWIDFPCPLAPWMHANGHDQRPSAAALIRPGGSSSFVCKGCHQHGPLTKLINLLATYREDDSLRALIAEANAADAQSALSVTYEEFDRPVVTNEIEPLIEEQFDGLYEAAWQVPEARAYLQLRGVNDVAAQLLGLCFDPTQRRILFPVRDRRGRLYGFTGRAIDPGVQPKIRDYYGLPKRHLILGENLWSDGKPLVIVEGLFGLASLLAHDVFAVANIGALLGSAMTPEKAARIAEFDAPTYLLLDNDQGGDIGLFGTLKPDGSREDNGAITQLTGHVPLFVPDWPEGKIDPDELTLFDIQKIISETPLYSGENPFDKTWVTWQ